VVSVSSGVSSAGSEETVSSGAGVAVCSPVCLPQAVSEQARISASPKAKVRFMGLTFIILRKIRNVVLTQLY
jgi:hypothetical protein